MILRPNLKALQMISMSVQMPMEASISVPIQIDDQEVGLMLHLSIEKHSPLNLARLQVIAAAVTGAINGLKV